VRAYRVAYDGQPYRGFQRQPDVPTVEDTLLAALRELGVLDAGVDTPPGYAAAGRTDAGVSAIAQTVAFEGPDWLSPAAFNSELPDRIRAWASADVPPEFHATHHATEREYTYFLHAPDANESRTVRVSDLDESRTARALDALNALSGTHDFHNLTPDATGTERSLATGLEREGPFLVCRFRAGGFPRQFVRRAVSVVAEVVRGEATLDRVDRLLSATPATGPEGVPPAPPEPLVLTAVSYRDAEFTVDRDAKERTRRLFEDLRVERSAAARVAGVLASVSDAHREQ
jgi:tRNA pseudouridine38-40 synthase